MTISNIDIKTLFQEGETELAFWQIRDRAEKIASTNNLFAVLQAQAKAGLIELLPNGNVKLIQKPAKKYYKTEMTNGVRCPNQLTNWLLIDMREMLIEQTTYSEDIEVWEKRLIEHIAHLSQVFPKCSKPYITKWDNRKGKHYIGVYASQSVHDRSGSCFLTISCEPLN